MGKYGILGIVIVLVIIVGGAFLLGNKSQNKTAKPTPTTVQNSPTPVAASAEDEMMKKKMEIMESAMKDKDSLKAELKDVSGGTGSGEAFNLRKNGKLLHTATARVPEVAGGSFYEGWIVDKTTKQFESTGKLEKQKDGSYEVSKEFDTLFEGYDFVVITLEKVDDKKPEKHILEGTAQ